MGIIFESAKEKGYFCRKRYIMFETELATYYKNLDRLREENPLGGFVVIKGETILDVWLNDLDALKEGFKAFGEERFMIKDINERPIDIRSFGSAASKIIL
jgi:hypothetical protein